MSAEPLSFDFTEPVADVRSVSPIGQPLPPFQGATTQSKHASWTGALAAQERRSANLETLRALWRQPRTINAVAALSGLPVASICSLKKCLGDELEVVDLECVSWGPDRRMTRRTRWRIRGCQPANT